ncbi:MAG: ATP phosphoribosyltransferase [Acidimicrobiales bacterium]|jgi:ATP phosphoribosyltransferase
MKDIIVAIPSKGRLRDGAVDLMGHAGINARTSGGASTVDPESRIRFLEMRPRDAAAWLQAGRIAAAFISTDTALEAGVADYPSIPLGFSSSDLVIACRDDSGFESPADLTGKTIATHLPKTTRQWLAERSIDANVVTMGGALEGVCALGLADAIVDLRQTGNSLALNNLHTLEVLVRCQAILAWNSNVAEELEWVTARIQAAVEGRKAQYLIFHLPTDQVSNLGQAFEGLESPTVLPLDGHDDLVAVHVVVKTSEMWSHLADLRTLGASGVVALPVHALMP